MPIQPLNVANLGFIAVDVSGSIDKSQRGHQNMQFVEVLPERTFGEEDWEVRNPGDFENIFFWKHVIANGAATSVRGVVGAYSFAIPALNNRNKGVADWRPLGTRTTQDLDFERLDDTAIQPTMMSYGGTRIPGRVETAVLATTGHGTRELLGFMSGGPIVAQHRGPDRPQYSRHVFDIDADGNLDAKMHAGLHGPFHVADWIDSYCQGQTGTPNTAVAVLLNASSAPDSSGYLGAHYADAEAVLSKERGGPLWRATKDHTHGGTRSGKDVRAGSIQMDALFTHSDKFDFPWQYELTDYVPASDGVFPLKVHFRPNRDLFHDWCGKRLKGRWDWEVFSPIGQLPPCTASRTKRKDANGNPRETAPPVAPTYAVGAHMAPGIIFQSRAGVLAGAPKRPPNYVAP